jgi:hypothetical protein
MKTVLALAVLALLGFAAAGCGSGKKKTSAGSITVTGRTTTISSVATGTLITCKGGTGGAAAPPPGQEVAGFGDGPDESSMIRVARRKDRSAVVTCRHS